jgi:hypothetical protein
MKRWLAMSGLLVLPVVADAECAWLLWTRTTHVKPLQKEPWFEEGTRWERGTAVKTFEQCLHVKQRVWEVVAEDNLSTGSNVEKVDKVPGEVVFVEYKSGWRINRWLSCYPDTVDPRK